MDIYSTYYMLAAVREMKPEHTFFKRRYFPTNTAMDVFGTSKVLGDYKEGSQKRHPSFCPVSALFPSAVRASAPTNWSLPTSACPCL